MDNNSIEIIEDSVNNTPESNAGVVSNEQNVQVPNTTTNQNVKVNEKKLKKQQKLEEKRRIKEEKKRLKQERKLAKKNKGVVTNSNVEQSMEVEVVETAVTMGSSGSKVIGKINGENVIPTNDTLPSPIDITVKQQLDSKNKIKKVKVITKKDRIISIIVTIFVILGFGAAGYGVYYFGYENNPAIFELKTINLELGDELPNTATYYVTSPKSVDDMTYSLDLSRVAQNITGSYPYSVTHQNATKTGTINVKDTKPPKLTIKDSEKLVFMKDSVVKVDDIVESCEDVSECDYKTEFVIDTSTQGEKNITITAKDNVNNTTNLDVTIKIIEISKTVLCISPVSVVKENVVSSRDEHSLYFDSKDYLVKSSGARRYMYYDYTEYFNFIREHENDDEYIIDRMTFAYLTKININTNNLTSFSDLMNYYTENGYVCSTQ